MRMNRDRNCGITKKDGILCPAGTNLLKSKHMQAKIFLRHHFHGPSIILKPVSKTNIYLNLLYKKEEKDPT